MVGTLALETINTPLPEENHKFLYITRVSKIKGSKTLLNLNLDLNCAKNFPI